MSVPFAETARRPEQIPFPPLDQLTVENIGLYTDGSLAVAEYHVNGIRQAYGAEDQPPTWDNTVGEFQSALEAVGYEGEGGRWPMLVAAVHPDEAIRTAAGDACGKQDTFMQSMYAEAELYGALKAFSDTETARSLEGERALALAVIMKEFEMAGHGLEDDGARARLLELKAELRELGDEFGRNMRRDIQNGLKLEEHEKSEFSPEQLDSFLPRDNDGNVPDPTDHRLPLNKPAVDAILEHHPNRDLRKRVYEAFNSRGAPENQTVLARVANTRLEIARTLGYDSWAQLQTEGQLLGNSEEVLASYERLRAEVTAGTEQLYADIRQRFSLGQDIEPYDLPYYVTQMRREVDARISEFLPYDNVLKGLTNISKELLGIEVRDITEFPDQHEGRWHESVKFYEMRDGDGALLGRFAIDPHPRPGKRAGAATYTLQYPHQKESGEYHTPVTAIIANLTPPVAEGEQARLSLYDLRVLFHEFGHVLHTTLGQAEAVRLAGDNNRQEDFRELVSVFFERLADDPGTLRHLSTSEIPEELVTDYANAQRITSLLLTQRNLRFGRLDLAMHSATEALEEIDDLRLQAEEFSGTREGEAGAGWPASFHHMLMNRYSGRMQTYTWAAEQARVIQRLFDEAGDNGAKGQVGQHLRAMMERGGAAAGSELLEKFLQAARDTLRAATIHRSIGSAAAESTDS